MVPILSLLAPIFVAAVLVFVVSSILHMVLTYHRADYRRLPHEAAAMDALRHPDLTPGHYFFPWCPGMKEMKSPEMQEKLQRGPVGMLTIIPSGGGGIGKNLATWFAFLLVVSVFVAYLTGRTLAPGAHYLQVFRIAGTVAFMAYGVGQIVQSVWHGAPWSNTARALVDGSIYALVTGGAFGWLWPR